METFNQTTQFNRHWCGHSAPHFLLSHRQVCNVIGQYKPQIICIGSTTSSTRVSYFELIKMAWAVTSVT